MAEVEYRFGRSYFFIPSSLEISPLDSIPAASA
jgi:hypothetical protein